METKAPDAFRTISEVADELDLPQHVLRFWESRFHEIRPMKRGGGRRYYRPDDIDLLRGIRHLLYGEGYTIRGVQRILRDHGIKFVQSVWQEGALQPPHGAGVDSLAADPDSESGEDVGSAIVEDRGGGLLDRIPSLLGRDIGERNEIGGRQDPPMTAAPVPHVDPADRPGHRQPPPAPANAPAPGRGLSPDDFARLDAALRELTECRKLLDAIPTEVV